MAVTRVCAAGWAASALDRLATFTIIQATKPASISNIYHRKMFVFILTCIPVRFTNICFTCRSFQRDLHPLFLFAQCFGIMPLNVTSSKPSLFSFRMLYCCIVQTLNLIMLLTLLYYFIQEKKFDYAKMLPVIFFFNCFALAMNFFYISRKFPELISSWNKFDLEFPERKRSLKRTSSKVLALFMTLAFIEHFASKVQDYDSSTYCFQYFPTKFEAFTRSIIPKFFEVFPYSHPLGVYIVLTCFFSTVLWNFSDLFLIITFNAISQKLKKFNRKIVDLKSRHCDEKFWLHVRLNYVALHDQIKATNGVLSCLVMFSLLNDFYFICNQALGAFK